MGVRLQEEEEAEQEVDENRVSSLTEPEYEVTEGDGEADDIDGLSFESSMIGLEEGPKEEKEKEEKEKVRAERIRTR